MNTAGSTRPPVGPDLRDQTVVVVGGSGGVGEGVVRALLSSGATVVATGRHTERLDAMRARVEDPAMTGRLLTATLDAEASDLDARVADLAARHGAFDGVVVSVASWGDQGRAAALSLTDQQWDDLLSANLTSVFRLFRAFAPVTVPTGTIMQLNGRSADIPFPGSAGVALSAAATKSLTRTIAAELDGRGPRFYQVILGVVRTRARQAVGIDDPRWLTGEDVGAHVANLVAGTGPLVGTTVQYLLDRVQGPVGEDEARR